MMSDIVDLQAWSSGRNEPAPSTISQIVVFTCDRPRALRRALDSYVTGTRERALPDRSFTVFDDSRNVSVVGENRAVAADFARRGEVAVFYAGREQRARFADDLVHAGLPSDVVRFALLGEPWKWSTIGASRNAMLLSRPGPRVFCVDDDTECLTAASPDLVPDLALAHADLGTMCATDPCDLWAFADRETLMQAVALEPGDPLACHEPFLGRYVDECVAARLHQGRQVDISGRPRFLTTDSARRPRVVVTLGGLAGDCGWQAPTPYLWLTGKSFRSLTQSEDHYRMACRTREVVRIAPRPTIVDGSMNMIAACFGLDLSELVPPFLPAGRGEDAFFGMLLTACMPDACFAHLPWALVHSPIAPRRFEAGDLVKSVLGVDLFTVIASCLSSASDPRGDRPMCPTDRLRDIGRALESIGEMPAAVANHRLRRDVTKIIHRDLSILERRLVTAGASAPFWASDVRDLMQAAARAIRDDSYHLPAECLHEATIGVASERALLYIRLLGRLLQFWPEIVDVSGELLSSGHTLTKRVEDPVV